MDYPYLGYKDWKSTSFWHNFLSWPCYLVLCCMAGCLMVYHRIIWHKRACVVAIAGVREQFCNISALHILHNGCMQFSLIWTDYPLMISFSLPELILYRIISRVDNLICHIKHLSLCFMHMTSLYISKFASIIFSNFPLSDITQARKRFPSPPFGVYMPLKPFRKSKIVPFEFHFL